MQSGMTIGRLAKAAGMHVETIRYYQRRGLLDEPKKPLGGQRRYPPQAVLRLGFIRRAQNLGFSLEEVKSLLAFADGRHAAETRAIAEKKLATLATRAAELARMQEQLAALIEASRRTRSGRDPFVEALLDKPEAR